MYATLPLGRLVSVLVWPFGLILVGLIAFWQFPASPLAWIRTIGTAATIWALALLLLAGSSGRFAPWRVLWHWFPVFNRWFFPDLNGTWEGKTSSNWPVVKSMLDAATSAGGLDAATLETIPLQDDAITVTVKASLFYFRLTAKLSNTGGTSHSRTALVAKDPHHDGFQLQYLFSQDTPDAGFTDDASHLGAVTADLDLDDWEMNGYYWTRRKWRAGLSTAGKLTLRRVAR
ncbi:MAG: hypothetical protein J0I69_11650 [Altererythrobacter sp.]|nr:hypothetical protein [Altererythrobacter sp.]